MHKSFIRYRPVLLALIATFVASPALGQVEPQPPPSTPSEPPAGDEERRAPPSDEAEPAPGNPAEGDPTGAETSNEPNEPGQEGVGREESPARAASTPDAAQVPEPASEPAAPQPRPQPSAETSPSDDDYPRFEPSLRLMTGFERTSETRFGAQTNVTSERFGFFLAQARAQLQGKLTKRIELELSAELADAYDAEVVTSADKPPYLRDAFMNLRLKRAFQVTLGHFKRPMSALEHRNAGALQVRGRGLTNDLIIEDNAWGGRALGMQLWGRFKSIGLKWAAGVFDPGWAPSAALRPKGVDALARLSLEPIEGLTFGVNGGMKTLDIPPFDQYESFYGFGGDVELEFGGFQFLADALYAQLPEVEAGLEEQTAFGVVGLVAYDIPIVPDLALQPVLYGEYSDASVDHSNSETFRGVGGLNLIVHEKLRFMPQVELVRWIGEPSEFSPNEGTAFYLMVSLAI